MSKESNLFNEFNSVSLTEWKAQIEKDLKGKPLSSLTWNTLEGFDIEPYFTPENSYHYNENSQTKEGENNNWEINHLINITTEKNANEEALKALNGGVNSITFKGDFNDINILLKDILIDIITVNFITDSPEKVIKKLADFCSKNNFSTQKCNVSINYDYIIKNKLEELTKNIENSKEFNSKNITISNVNTVNAGANITQQLAILIAQGNEYLKNGFTNSNQFSFELYLGENYFFEIAKIRALRILWKNILTAYNINNTNTAISCSTSTLLWSKNDSENNILRASSTAMSAIIGGCDSLTITPHNRKNEDFSNRVAKNIQLLLKEESHLDKVKDPASGSYYIEHLTNTLAQNSWKLFQEIETKGGYLKAMESGFISEFIKQSADKLIEKFNNGQITIIGLTKYNKNNTQVSLVKENQENTPFPVIVLKEN